MHPSLASLVSFLLAATLCSVSQGSESVQLSFSAPGFSLALLDDDDATVSANPDRQKLPDADTLTSSSKPRPYATQDSTAWWFEVGAGSNFDEGWVPIGRVGFEWYPVEGFSLGASFDGIGVGLKDTSTTAGVDAALLIRWHVLRRTTWSLYFDGGCGFAVFADEVPTGASRFCFTPQLGVGITYEVADNARLLAGARWFHISNGQSATRNPGVDMLELYLGMTFAY